MLCYKNDAPSNQDAMALYDAVSQTSRIPGFSSQSIVVVALLVIILSDLFGESVLHVSMNLASMGPDSLCYNDFFL